METSDILLGSIFSIMFSYIYLFLKATRDMEKEIEMAKKPKPKFSDGDIVRYSDGSTALMKVSQYGPNDRTYHSPSHGYLFYGKQFFGSSMGAYEVDCRLATTEECKRWDKENEK